MSLFRGLGFRKDATRGTTPIEVRKSLAGLFSATGVMPGGPSPLLTGNADWTYTVAGPAWFVATRGPSDGVALYGNDGATVIGTTGVGSTVPIAPGAGLQRIDIAWTRHQSAGENGDPATTVANASEPLFGVESGVAAASNPVAPTIPAGAIELGRNTMTSAATSTASAGNTITQSAPVAALRGTEAGAVLARRMFGASPGLVGGTPAAGAVILEQAGVVTVTTNGSGDANFTYPVAFPNGVLSVQLTRFDYAIGNTTHILNATQTVSACNVRVYQSSGAVLPSTSGITYVYTAIGW